ncbi:14318_t:CDS:1 [Gigaspora rosea]|nr:14318_t:CDS:1 [Gigaspora rosea]
MIKLLLEKLKVKQNFFTPYHPVQMVCLVERFNKTLCESLGKLVKNIVDWNLLIPSILFAYRTARNSTTKISPFFLVYGCEARQPIHPSHSDELLEGMILQKTFELINEVPLVRYQTVEKLHQKQKEIKTYHDRKICVSFGFKIGNKVLLENAKKRYSWSNKLTSKCTGPYYVHDKLLNDMCKLRTLDGKVISAPFNLSLLKKYHDREEAEVEDRGVPVSS